MREIRSIGAADFRTESVQITADNSNEKGDPMTIRKWILSGLVCFIPLANNAQDSLTAAVSEAQAEWMFGKWEAWTDDGQTVALNVSWDLNKNVVVLHIKIAEMEIKGYSAFDVLAGQVTYVSFDNRGDISKGSWDIEGGELVLRLTGYSHRRGAWKMAAVFGGNSADGLQLRLHEVDSYGGLATPARTELKFKKQ